MTNLILLDPTIVESDEPRVPITWAIEDNIIYQDLTPILYDDAMEFIKNEYIKKNLLCRVTKICQNPEGMKELCERILFLISAECSLIAIEKDTNRIVGINIMRIMEHSDYGWIYWQMMKINDPDVNKILNFQYSMVRYLYKNKNFDFSETMHYFIVVVSEDSKGQMLKEKLLLHSYYVARSVGVKTITWVCETKNDQQRALRIGMTNASLIYFKKYVNRQNEIIFSDTGLEHTAILFAMKVGPRAATSINEETVKYLIDNLPNKF